MADKIDPNLWPKELPLKLSEFVLLRTSLQWFYCLLLEECPQNSPPLPTEVVNVYADLWLTAGFNKAPDLDTKLFEAATLIRDKYQPAMMQATKDSLKSTALELMRQIDQ